MPKKVKRVLRDQPLTAEEKSRYDEIRRKVQAEFPPKRPANRPVEIGAIMHALKEARTSRGLTLAEVAKVAGIEPPNLSTLENASDPNPTIGTLRRYAAAVGKTIRVVLDDAPVPPGT